MAPLATAAMCFHAITSPKLMAALLLGLTCCTMASVDPLNAQVCMSASEIANMGEEIINVVLNQVLRRRPHLEYFVEADLPDPRFLSSFPWRLPRGRLLRPSLLLSPPPVLV